LNKRVALITGATGGIGREIATRLLQNNWKVGVHGRDVSVVNDLCHELGENASPLVFDVSEKQSVSEEIRKFARTEGGLDALIHTAGLMEDTSISMVGEELLDKVFQTNVYGSFWVLQACLKPMIKNKHGAVVLVSSIAGIDGAKGQTVYSASKAAVNALVKSASKEVARFGIRVNAVAPGPVETKLFSFFDEEVKSKILSSIPLGRIATPGDVASMAMMLIGDESEYVTGQVIRIDGGLTV
jgi:3-oxoacyl-[acyl-carrier protein] reductase